MLLSIILLSASAAAPVDCAPPKEAHALLSRRSLRWLLLGERGHGTNEIPRHAADFVCAATAADRPVIFGVEFASANQPALDAYMTSNGGPTARASLLAAPMWDPDWADGKSSRAMLALLDWLRVQYQRGAVRAVIAFDVNSARGGADRERQMAERLKAKAPGANGIFIALTGSFHARIRLSDSATTPYPPMGALLPREYTISIRIQGNGGRKWSCTEGGCGENDAEQTGHNTQRPLLRAATDNSYDFEYDLGIKVTSSKPVKLQLPNSIKY